MRSWNSLEKLWHFTRNCMEEESKVLNILNDHHTKFDYNPLKQDCID